MSTNEAEVQTPVLAEEREDGTKAYATRCSHRNEGDHGPITQSVHDACTAAISGLFSVGTEETRSKGLSLSSCRVSM